MTPNWLAGMNPNQMEAVRTLHGPLLVLAGAGAGKTRVITYRIANLIRNGANPARILAVTFTNKAAKEMRERALKLLQNPTEGAPLIATFHALCVNILRQDRDVEQLGITNRFSILDRSDQETIARNALREVKADPKAIPHHQLLGAIGRWKTAGLRANQVEADPSHPNSRLLQSAYAVYERALRSTNSVDFDDLLFYTEELLRGHPEAKARQAGRFDFLLVDEYQDTNGAQYRILRLLLPPTNNVCVVGDDDQAIYGWRGADVHNILRFERDFPGAKVIRLQENYRSCPNILELANRLIVNNRSRHPKEMKPIRPVVDRPILKFLQDEVSEAGTVAADILAVKVKRNVSFRDFAVLFRTNEQPRVFETEFRGKGIPYVLIGGYSFFDRKEVRDLLAWMKTLHNPADEPSLRRIMNVPPRGLGETIQTRMTERAIESGKPLWAILPDLVNENALPAKVVASLRWLLETIQRFQAELNRGSLTEVIRTLIHYVDYKAEIVRLFPEESDRQSRWDSVSELLNMLARYEEKDPAPTLAGFLEQVTLAAQDADDKEEKKKDAVTLITYHGAKGLEFPYVYMVGMEEGLLPHERSVHDLTNIEEERRLCYVGVTRARDRLAMTFCATRKKFGKTMNMAPSRFLAELLGRPVEVPTGAASAPTSSGAAPTRRSPSNANRGFKKHRFR